MAGPTDISIDLETTGNKFNAGILSIGAVAFNRHDGSIGPEFYASVRLEDALRYGVPSASTLRWWMTQGKTAAKVFDDPNAMPLYDALRGLNDFIRARPANACIWGNGSSFDITILEHAFYALGRDGFTPHWADEQRPLFWLIRDLRTLVDLAVLNKSEMAFEGTAHNALDDARHQAKLAVKAIAKIKRMQVTPDADKAVPSSQSPAQEDDW